MNPPNISFPYWYYAGCFNVVDGDTYDLQFDFGMMLWQKDRFRAYGINAPELTSKDPVVRAQAQLARQFCIDRILGRTIESKSLIINTHLDKREKYGRILADVYYCDASGVWSWLNDELIQAGLAVVYLP